MQIQQNHVQISAQCSPSRNSTDEFSENSPLECVKGVCVCRTGFSHIDGECKRWFYRYTYLDLTLSIRQFSTNSLIPRIPGVMCTIGLRGEPSVDRNNQLIQCERSSDCSQGQMCDPNTHVCCKGVNSESMGQLSQIDEFKHIVKSSRMDNRNRIIAELVIE